MRVVKAYAVVGKNDRLWIDMCHGRHRGQFFIYRTKREANINKVEKTDSVKKIEMYVVEK